ncbi:MAG: hypothetical protein ACXWNV_13760, partial [Vulcanimicrobiaceae bacterium]
MEYTVRNELVLRPSAWPPRYGAVEPVRGVIAVDLIGRDGAGGQPPGLTDGAGGSPPGVTDGAGGSG